MNQNSLSTQDALLHAALVCGVTPEKPYVHRLQLFFCASFIVGKKSTDEAFQGNIQRNFDGQDPTTPWLVADRGLYKLTPAGYEKAKRLFPTVSPKFSPATTLSEVHYKLAGHYDNHSMILERKGRRFEVTIDGRLYNSAGDACTFLGITRADRVGRSEPRILYDLAVNNDFVAA
jgi:hypothetical protein